MRKKFLRFLDKFTLLKHLLNFLASVLVACPDSGPDRVAGWGSNFTPVDLFHGASVKREDFTPPAFFPGFGVDGQLTDCAMRTK